MSGSATKHAFKWGGNLQKMATEPPSLYFMYNILALIYHGQFHLWCAASRQLVLLDQHLGVSVLFHYSLFIYGT